ncbi:unnamed protein product [Sympodiomycopsis kandeliae]
MPSNRAQQRATRQKLTKSEDEVPRANVLTQRSEWVTYSSESGDDSEDGSDYGQVPNVPLVDLQQTAESLMSEMKEDSMSPRVEKFLDLLIWSIPFTSLYVLLDVMIHQQYALHPTLLEEFGRMIGTVPILVTIVWSTTISPKIPQRALQILFFIASILLGSAFVWTFHQSPFMEVVRRTPPLGTLWIYCVVKLDLIPCVVSVATVGAFVWWNQLPLLSHTV